MKYKIIVRYDAESLEKEVNRLLKESWKLSGGLVVVAIPQSGSPTDVHYYQALRIG